MLEDLPDVPPAVCLLVTAYTESSNWTHLRKIIKSMMKDLRDQSVAYEINSFSKTPIKASSLQFDVHLHGGLDLFDGSGACADLVCRLQAADRLIRSMGLISDRIWLTDTISEKFIDFGRVTNEKLNEIVADTLVLARLAPLIFAGIVRFRSPWRSTCEDCTSNFDNNVALIAKELAKKFSREIKFSDKKNGNYTIDTGNFFEPSLMMHNIFPEERIPNLRDSREAIIYSQVRSAMWVSRDASLFGGSMFSNSRIGMAGILHQEGRFSDRRQLMMLDRDRSIQVPWVSELDAMQILELRQEAADALPMFREKMAKVLAIGSGQEDDDLGASNEFVQELREQVEEVRSELSITQKSSARFWKSTYGLLGFGISAYGVSTDQLIPGVGGLLPLINLLIGHVSGHEKDVLKLTHRPGYVLVKAQDILSHAN
ncbi:hypothetical protein ACO0LC_28650 [Undibacterium sp. JH2W]|uniref:hypothetical protein n=1 Tax=Undibacterium sp. JH2W TaxID=3413037 RepID=UPI003BF07FDA